MGFSEVGLKLFKRPFLACFLTNLNTLVSYKSEKFSLNKSFLPCSHPPPSAPPLFWRKEAKRAAVIVMKHSHFYRRPLYFYWKYQTEICANLFRSVQHENLYINQGQKYCFMAVPPSQPPGQDTSSIGLKVPWRRASRILLCLGYHCQQTQWCHLVLETMDWYDRW